ncbi:hypothetical protein C2G38_2119806 [Gigaspora rosea]|uniref:Uncharacterized protein n=1 Tax=Gigaspora rosea TaxID=44941 RepID=A0A397U7T0_9GLOM|nr:hypothetical protein C2G38_2119806 [Gigaspora rosea]
MIDSDRYILHIPKKSFLEEMFNFEVWEYIPYIVIFIILMILIILEITSEVNHKIYLRSFVTLTIFQFLIFLSLPILNCINSGFRKEIVALISICCVGIVIEKMIIMFLFT